MSIMTFQPETLSDVSRTESLRAPCEHFAGIGVAFSSLVVCRALSYHPQRVQRRADEGDSTTDCPVVKGKVEAMTNTTELKPIAKLMVVDQSESGRKEIAEVLSRKPEWNVVHAAVADEALSELVESGVDLLLIGIDTYEAENDLVPRVRDQFPGLPVLIIAPDCNRPALVKALMLGAASYVPRGNLARELMGTVQRLLSLRGNEYRRRLAECLQTNQCRLVLRNDQAMIPVVVGYLRDSAEEMGICSQRDSFRLAVALEETLTNSLIHGNLEVSSELRGLDDSAHIAQIEERLATPPYCHRTITVDALFSNAEVRFVITDEGPGFDPHSVPDPTDLANVEKPHGRGLLLMKSFMDEVIYNDKGNQVMLVQRRRADGVD